MVNVKIQNTVPNARLVATVPNVRVTKSYTTTTVGAASISVGMPIGLLLALTYATAQGGSLTTTTTSDTKPSVRIITN